MEYILEAENVTKEYKGCSVVDRVSLQVKKGEIYGFVGENGAGKTSFMKMIVGLTKISSGTLKLFESQDLQTARRNIGTMIETPAYYPNLSTYDNLMLHSMMYGYGKNEEEVNGILEKTGLINEREKKAKNLSLGNRQRLGIGIALLGNPAFLILDEPMNGLDPAGIKEIRELLRKLNKTDGITIFISSHILGELSKLATCYGVMHEGRLVLQLDGKDVEREMKEKNWDIDTYFIHKMEGK